jgi:ribose transport system ATP-binding protein
VKAVADRFVVLRDGRNVGAGKTADVDAREIAALMVGRDVDDLYPRSERRAGEAVLEVSALQPGAASFALHRGEVLGIAGLLGAGRTHLLRTLFGLEPVRGGLVRLGAYVGAFAPHARWRQGMGLVSEDRSDEGLAAGLSIADNLTMTKLDGLGPSGLVWPSRQDAAARRWIEQLGIRCEGPRQAIADLSGGNQQKVAIARLLHHDVDVLLLDEPTRGIDVASKAQIYRLIDDVVASRSGSAKAVLLVSSYFPELLGVCDRIAVMSRGVLGAPRPASEWTEHELILAASGAMAS